MRIVIFFLDIFFLLWKICLPLVSSSTMNSCIKSLHPLFRYIILLVSSIFLREYQSCMPFTNVCIFNSLFSFLFNKYWIFSQKFAQFFNSKYPNLFSFLFKFSSLIFFLCSQFCFFTHIEFQLSFQLYYLSSFQYYSISIIPFILFPILFKNPLRSSWQFLSKLIPILSIFLFLEKLSRQIAVKITFSIMQKELQIPMILDSIIRLAPSLVQSRNLFPENEK